MNRIQRVIRTITRNNLSAVLSNCYVLNRIPFRNYFIQNRNFYANRIFYCSSSQIQEKIVDSATFERVSDETLESLTEIFEEIVEGADNLATADVSYSSGVLSVNLGEKYGIYVINRQSPNRQIWLSSPTSGPKRYDYVEDGGYWIYKHDMRTLHSLLQEEISQIVKSKVDFSVCSYSKL